MKFKKFKRNKNAMATQNKMLAEEYGHAKTAAKKGISDLKVNMSSVLRFISTLKFKDTPKQKTYEVVKPEEKEAVTSSESSAPQRTAARQIKAGIKPKTYYLKWLETVTAEKAYPNNFE